MWGDLLTRHKKVLLCIPEEAILNSIEISVCVCFTIHMVMTQFQKESFFIHRPLKKAIHETIQYIMIPLFCLRTFVSYNYLMSPIFCAILK